MSFDDKAGTFFTLQKKGGYAGATYQAEDLAQEVWRKVFQHATTYKPVSPFKSWLITITRNTIFDWFKKAYLREEILDAELTPPGNDNDDNHFIEHHFLWENGPDIETDTIKKSVLSALNDCKDKLDDDAYRLIDMFLNEKSQREMALATHISWAL